MQLNSFVFRNSQDHVAGPEAALMAVLFRTLVTDTDINDMPIASVLRYTKRAQRVKAGKTWMRVPNAARCRKGHRYNGVQYLSLSIYRSIYPSVHLYIYIYIISYVYIYIYSIGFYHILYYIMAILMGILMDI